ncbi:MAG TPA: MFS transporter, partial [Ktedonobacteraceae bacterium]
MTTRSITGIQDGQEKQAGRWRWVTLALVSMALFLDTVDVSIVNVALPDIQRDLQLTTTELQWVQGIYVLTYAGFMLLGGRAADLLGRRRIFLMGATLFGLASLTGGVAHSGWLLILARGVQGIGAALTMPSATSILTTTFAEGPERNRALGIFSATGGAGFTCGLVLGGVLTDFISWHWIFFVTLPFVLLILLARGVVPEGRSTIGERSYDLPGAITVTAGLLLLVYATTQANEEGATPLKTVGLFALALFILALFLIIERFSKAPLIPLRIFRLRTLCASSMTSLALLGSFFGFLFICTLYLQNVLHYSPLLASLALLPASIASILVSHLVAPWLMNRLGLRLSTGLGLLSLFFGCLLFLRTGANADYIGVILPSTMLTLGIGMPISIPTLAVAAVAGIDPSEQGLASGLQGTLGQAGGGLGLAITTAVVTAVTISAQGETPGTS